MVGKYIEKFLAVEEKETAASESKINMAFLADNGFL